MCSETMLFLKYLTSKTWTRTEATSAVLHLLQS